MSNDVERVRQMTGLTMGEMQARNHLRQRAALARLPDPRWARLRAEAQQKEQQPATVPVPLAPEVAHSQQPGAPVAPTITGRLEPIEQPWTWRDALRAAAAVAFLFVAAASCTGCGGGDASDDEVAQHDQQASATVQPVTCAASGCTR